MQLGSFGTKAIDKKNINRARQLGWTGCLGPGNDAATHCIFAAINH